MSSHLRLLVATDIHYDPCGERFEEPFSADTSMGLELLGRAIEDAKARGGFDAIALLGDLINDGTQPHAHGAIAEMLGAVRAAAPGVPLLILPGNHDFNGDDLPTGLDGTTRVEELGGYRSVVIVDRYREAMHGRRSETDRRLLADVAAQPGGPIVVLQHNPIDPPIQSEYPFMLDNGQDVAADYRRAGVLLSMSGHYHVGQPMHVTDGVHYVTLPALCEEPHRYAIVTLRGREVDSDVRELGPAGN